jgi:hypothetical protein
MLRFQLMNENGLFENSAICLESEVLRPLRAMPSAASVTTPSGHVFASWADCVRLRGAHTEGTLVRMQQAIRSFHPLRPSCGASSYAALHHATDHRARQHGNGPPLSGSPVVNKTLGRCLFAAWFAIMLSAWSHKI